MNLLKLCTIMYRKYYEYVGINLRYRVNTYRLMRIIGNGVTWHGMCVCQRLSYVICVKSS